MDRERKLPVLGKLSKWQRLGEQLQFANTEQRMPTAAKLHIFRVRQIPEATPLGKLFK